MENRKVILVILMAMLGALFTALPLQAQEGDVLSLMPPDCDILAKVNNPSQFLDNFSTAVNEISPSAGTEATMAIMSGISQSLGPELYGQIVMEAPVGVGLNFNSYIEPSLYFIFQVKDFETFCDTLADSGNWDVTERTDSMMQLDRKYSYSADQTLYVLKMGAYVAVTSDDAFYETLTENAVYAYSGVEIDQSGANDVFVRVNVDKLVQSNKTAILTGKQMLLQQLGTIYSEENEMQGMPNPKVMRSFSKLFKSLIGKLFNLIFEVKTVSIGVSPTMDSFKVSLAVEAIPDSTLAKIINEQSSQKLTMVNYLPADMAYGGVFVDTYGETTTEVVRDLAADVDDAFELGEDSPTLVSIFDRWLAVAGGESMFALIPAAEAESGFIQGYGVNAIKDPEEVRAIIKDSMGIGEALIEKLELDQFVKINFNLTTDADAIDNIPIDKLEFTFEFNPDLPGSEMMKEMFEKMYGSSIEVYYAATDDMLITYFGHDLDNVKSFITRLQSPTPPELAQPIAVALAKMPEESNGVLLYNFPKYFSMSMAAMSEIAPPGQPNPFAGMPAYATDVTSFTIIGVKNQNGVMVGDIDVPIDQIRGMVEIFGMMMNNPTQTMSMN